MESELIDEEGDFQEPIQIPTDSFIRKKRQRENDSDEEEEGTEVTACPLCQTHWTNTGPHRIVNLKCGHVFGKSCIDSHIKDMLMKSSTATCPICNKYITKSEPRTIWPSKLIPENDTDLQPLKVQIQKAKETLQELIQQNQAIKSDINLYKTALDNLNPLHVLQDLVNQSNQLTSIKSEPRQERFVLQHKVGFPNELYGVLDLHPFTFMAIATTYKASNQLYGLRKFNLYDPAITEFVPTHHTAPIRDIQHASGEMVLTTGDDKTLKLISTSKSLVVQSYTLNAPSLACSFDEKNPNRLCCGLSTGVVMVYDIRNIKTHLHALTKPVAPRTIRSIACCDDTIVCLDEDGIYIWSLDGHETYQYSFSDFISNERVLSAHYQDRTFYTVTSNAMQQQHRVSHLDRQQMVLDWSCESTMTGSWRNTTHFKRNEDIFICYCGQDNQVIIRDEEKEVQRFQMDGARINDIAHVNINQTEFFAALSSHELLLYKYH
ncbi:MAG: WD40-repeat-containing domain protein [Benjaminiella poitrasii]|nr:MAG: WD40-repeat-containing domain protein [Benjaminiella poitrasii]